MQRQWICSRSLIILSALVQVCLAYLENLRLELQAYIGRGLRVILQPAYFLLLLLQAIRYLDMVY